MSVGLNVCVLCPWQERVLSFGNVELNDKTTDDRNAAEMAVARGFASVIRHRRYVSIVQVHFGLKVMHGVASLCIAMAADLVDGVLHALKLEVFAG